MNTDSSEQNFFLNGWIGVRLAERWLRAQGFRVERAVKQRRGTEKSVSSGDIDLVGRKASEALYVEVKFWGAGSKRCALDPSWLVEFMLDRNKLNTLFEPHEDATEYLLVYRYPPDGTFTYDPKRKYIARLVSYYRVPASFIQGLSGQPCSKFAQEILQFLVNQKIGRRVRFRIVYFGQILRELDETRLGEYGDQLRNELDRLFEKTYSNVIGDTQHPS